MKQERLYYMWSVEVHKWFKAPHEGYTNSLQEAYLYTFNEADKTVRRDQTNNIEIPVGSIRPVDTMNTDNITDIDQPLTFEDLLKAATADINTLIKWDLIKSENAFGPDSAEMYQYFIEGRCVLDGKLHAVKMGVGVGIQQDSIKEMIALGLASRRAKILGIHYESPELG